MINCNFENFACKGGYLMTTIDYLQTDVLVSSDCEPYKGFADNCTYQCSNSS